MPEGANMFNGYGLVKYLHVGASIVWVGAESGSQRPLVSYHGGCRDEPGMTKGEAESHLTSSGALLERGTRRTAKSLLTTHRRVPRPGGRTII